MISHEEVYPIGRIGKTHGVRGEVTMHIDDDVFDRTDADYLVLDIDGILVPFYMEEYRFRSAETVLMKFADIDTMEQARQLTGTEVFFPRHLAEADDGMPTWASLVGYSLTDSATGERVGTIDSIDDSTLNILFSIRRGDGTVVLVPAAAELIDDIDTASRTIRMSIPNGLLEI